MNVCHLRVGDDASWCINQVSNHVSTLMNGSIDASVSLPDSLLFLSQRVKLSIRISQVLRLHNSTVTVSRDSIQVSICKSFSFPQSSDGPFLSWFFLGQIHTNNSLHHSLLVLPQFKIPMPTVVNLHPSRELVPILSLEVYGVAQPACQGVRAISTYYRRRLLAHAVGAVLLRLRNIADHLPYFTRRITPRSKVNPSPVGYQRPFNFAIGYEWILLPSFCFFLWLLFPNLQSLSRA